MKRLLILVANVLAALAPVRAQSPAPAAAAGLNRAARQAAPWAGLGDAAVGFARAFIGRRRFGWKSA